MGTKKIAKTVISFASGYQGLKAGAGELRGAAAIPVSAIRSVVDTVRDVRVQAKEDRELLKTLGEKAIWEMMVKDYSITTKTVKSRYKVTCFVNLLILFFLASFFGYLVANIGVEKSMATNLMCGVYVYMLVLMLFHNAYRMNIASSQSMVHPLKFLKMAVKNPMLLIAKPLPDNYKVKT